MKILTVNVGSSSIKYAVYQNKKLLGKHKIDRVTVDPGLTYKRAFEQMFRALVDKKYVRTLTDIDAIAHRVVHAGKLQDHCRITQEIVKKIRVAKELAPLHDTPGLRGIEICLKKLKCPQFAILDTAFHKSIPKKAATYGIPLKLQKKLNLKRYGFHGTSHEYIARTVHATFPKARRVISCHLGNGSSITAIKEGKSIDTSMGVTPLEGVLMGTRTGNLDPGILLYLMHHEKYSVAQLSELLNKQSGFKGLCGYSDIRDILKSGSKEASLAIDIFCYQVAKYIGAYTAALDGLDVLVFTAGIGEHHPSIRKQICDYVKFLGVHLDAKKNQKNAQLISTTASKVKVLVIETDEEQMMIEHTLKLLRQ